MTMDSGRRVENFNLEVPKRGKSDAGKSRLAAGMERSKLQRFAKYQKESHKPNEKQGDQRSIQSFEWADRGAMLESTIHILVRTTVEGARTNDVLSTLCSCNMGLMG
ncbi:hypothetical protein E4U19_008096 [Claviceps sp. Clav32 group G5]|nr:hypothetical protein E4U19_008096 [Claviceps sp. Clav32 group G5]